MATERIKIEDNTGNIFLPCPALETKTAAQWIAENKVLVNGEMVQESDTKLIKIGDGVTAYKSLSYANAFQTQSFYTSDYGNSDTENKIKFNNAGGNFKDNAGVFVTNGNNGLFTFTKKGTYLVIASVSATVVGGSNFGHLELNINYPTNDISIGVSSFTTRHLGYPYGGLISTIAKVNVGDKICARLVLDCSGYTVWSPSNLTITKIGD